MAWPTTNTTRTDRARTYRLSLAATDTSPAVEIVVVAQQKFTDGVISSQLVTVKAGGGEVQLDSTQAQAFAAGLTAAVNAFV